MIHLEDLDYSSQQFAHSARGVQQKFWWKNVKV